MHEYIGAIVLDIHDQLLWVIRGANQNLASVCHVIAIFVNSILHSAIAGRFTQNPY